MKSHRCIQKNCINDCQFQVLQNEIDWTLNPYTFVNVEASWCERKGAICSYPDVSEHLFVTPSLFVSKNIFALFETHQPVIVIQNSALESVMTHQAALSNFRWPDVWRENLGGGGFHLFLMFALKLAKWSHLSNIFQTGCSHQVDRNWLRKALVCDHGYRLESQHVKTMFWCMNDRWRTCVLKP